MATEYPTTSIEYLSLRRNPESFVTSRAERLVLDNFGIVSTFSGNHRGHFVRAGVRDEGFHRRGEESERDRKFNHRQLSIIDLASLDHVGDGLDIDPDVVVRRFGESRTTFLARHMGANIVFGTVSDGRTLNDIRPPY